MKNQLESPSYMELKMHQDEGPTYVLRIPTFWDSVNEKWIGAIKTPKTGKLIHAEGFDSFSLQNDFNKKFYDAFHDKNFCDEIYSMFKKEDDE